MDTTTRKQDRILTLVVEDWSGKGNLAALTEAMGEALIAVTDFQRTDERSGRVIDGWWLTFNASVLRDTNAHGMAFRSGFITWVEEAR